MSIMGKASSKRGTKQWLVTSVATKAFRHEPIVESVVLPSFREFKLSLKGFNLFPPLEDNLLLFRKIDAHICRLRITAYAQRASGVDEIGCAPLQKSVVSANMVVSI